MCRFPGSIAALATVLLVVSGRSNAVDDPLSYVPPGASFFAHLRVGDVLNTSLAQEIRKAAGTKLDKVMGEFKDAVGIPLDIVDTATFLYPNFPQGPGDQQLLIVIGTTSKPYDRAELLKKVREKDAKPNGDLVELQDKFTLRFVSDTMFLVAHNSLMEKYAKGPNRDRNEGVLTEALKLAGDKHQFAFGIDFSKLPNELFTAAPPQLQPFLPLLKSKTTCLFADLKGKELKVGWNFVAVDANASEDAERSFNLLMKLAGDGLADLTKDANADKDLGPFQPFIKDLQRGLKNIKVARDGVRLETSIAFQIEAPVDQIVAKVGKFYGAGGAAEGAQALNNLKQIGLAMHSYHDANNGFPPAAVCDKKGKPLLSWRVAILPYIEQDAIYRQFKLDEPWDSEHNKKLIGKIPQIYAVPGAKNDGKTHYCVFRGNDAAFDLVQQTRLTDITDGTSNTIMVAEAAVAVPWTKPDDIEFHDKLDVEKALRFVNDKTAVAFCDGSVRYMKKGVSNKTWHLLIQKNDGQVIADFDK